MKPVTIEEYANAVVGCLRLERQTGTSGSRVVAQVLLSAYNGHDYQLNVSDLCSLDPNNYELCITVIRGRYETGREPHQLVKDGGKIFQSMWKRWNRLHVKERGKEECPDCDGWGKLRSPGDEDGERSVKCSRCNGSGRVCGCGR